MVNKLNYTKSIFVVFPIILYLIVSCSSENGQTCPELDLKLYAINTDEINKDLIYTNDSLDTLNFKLDYFTHVENDVTIINPFNHHECENGLFYGYKHSLFNRMNFKIIASLKNSKFVIQGDGFETSFLETTMTEIDTIIDISKIPHYKSPKGFIKKLIFNNAIPVQLVDLDNIIWTLVP